MNSALDELGDMIRKQQQLRDKTFKEGQDMRRDRQRGQGKQQLGDLQQDQQALKDRLNKLLEQLRQRGMGQKGQGEKGEGEKGQGQGQGDEMGELGGAATPWARPKAISAKAMPMARSTAQGRALEAMRKGRARSGAADAARPRGRAWVRVPASRAATAASAPNRIPIRSAGRCAAASTATTRRSRCRARSMRQRARRILEELRKRFGESMRPQLELDYIERLLKDF